MKKIILGLGLLVLACWAFRALDYHFATRLKGPIYVTGLSGTRFIPFQREVVTDIMYEDADGDLKHIHEPLRTIDLPTLHPLDYSVTAAGLGRVDMRYQDKNYQYTIHDGEEKYLMRRMR